MEDSFINLNRVSIEKFTKSNFPKHDSEEDVNFDDQEFIEVKHVHDQKSLKETSKNHDLQKMDLKEFTMKKFE